MFLIEISRSNLDILLIPVIGLFINLMLVFGVFYAMSCTLVVWLVAYSINISGCFILFGVVINLLIKRHEEDQDVSPTTMMISLVPLFLAILYIICWFKNQTIRGCMKGFLRRKKSRFFICNLHVSVELKS